MKLKLVSRPRLDYTIIKSLVRKYLMLPALWFENKKKVDNERKKRKINITGPSESFKA